MHAGYSPCRLSLETGAPEIETPQSSGPLCKACSLGALCSEKHQSMLFHLAELCCAIYRCSQEKLQYWCIVNMHSMLVIMLDPMEPQTSHTRTRHKMHQCISQFCSAQHRISFCNNVTCLCHSSNVQACASVCHPDRLVCRRQALHVSTCFFSLRVFPMP